LVIVLVHLLRDGMHIRQSGSGHRHCDPKQSQHAAPSNSSKQFHVAGFPGVEGRILSLTFDAGTCPLYGKHQMELAAIAMRLGSTSGGFRGRVSAYEEADSGRRNILAGAIRTPSMARIYRESSHIQLTSHVFPPSAENDCSIRDDLGAMSSQT